MCADDSFHWFGVTWAGPREGRGVKGTAKHMCELRGGDPMGRKRVIMLEKRKLGGRGRGYQKQVAREWP